MVLNKCKKCSNDIALKKENFKCKDCECLFHPACINKDASETVTTRNNWRCERCSASSCVGRVGESASVSREDSTILDAIAAFRKENNERWDINNAKLDEFKSDLKTVKEDVSILKTTSSRNTVAVQDISQQNELLKSQIVMLKSEVADLQQQTRKNNIIVTGLPTTTAENVYAILEKLANVLQIEFNRFDISTAHRLRQGPALHGKKPAPPSIVVNFVSRSVKSDWMTARKHKKRLSAREINHSFPDQPVYLNDHLAAHTREIFNAARTLVKTRKLLSVWTNDGRVMARRSTTGKPFRIHDLDDVRKIVETMDGSRAESPPPTGPAVVTHQASSSQSSEEDSCLGAGIAEKVMEMILDGRIRKVEEVCGDEQTKTLELLSKVWGAGPATVQSWYQQGFRTLEDLESKASLTKQQKIGLKYFDEIQDRMSRSEVEEIARIVKEKSLSICKNVELVICGSYRRGKQTCGDVDLLLIRPDELCSKELLISLLAKLKTIGFISDDLTPLESNGNHHKYMGLCKLPGEERKHRRLDIFIVPESERAPALMHYTGSALFNRSIRLLASRKSMSLSEHSLSADIFRKGAEKCNEGRRIETPSEESIFKILGLEYRPPEERDH